MDRQEQAGGQGAELESIIRFLESSLQRDINLVREILLAIEASSYPDLSSLFTKLGQGQRSFQDPVCYHVKMLVEEAGLLSAIDAKSFDGPYWLRIELTWAGHEFVDAVRDSEVWKAAKSGVQAAGGFSLDLLAAVAKGLLKKKIEQHTGITVDI